MDHTPEEFSSPNDCSQRLDYETTSETSFAAEENNHAPKPRFQRRHSMTAPTTHGSGSPASDDRTTSDNAQNGSPSRNQTERDTPNTVKASASRSVSARLCGPSRSKCGYCGGSRLHVLEVDDGFNKVVPIVHHDGRGKNDGSRGQAIGDDSEDRGRVRMVDEKSTSKSYGLLFDYLPYDTYQELIDRGWRRSGKHLYRPHNFESCCPAISIRLDTTKFASYYGSANKSNRSEIENTVLVGGSKSQKRVGRNLLRALESYNAKYGRSSPLTKQLGRSDEIEDHFPSPGSTYASRVAKMKLVPDAKHDTARNGGLAVDDSKRKNKKSRQESPQREDEAACTLAQQNSTLPHRDAPSTKFVTDRQLLRTMEESERDLLQQLALLTYQIITEQVLQEIETRDGEIEGQSKKRPHWAWWNDDGSVDNTNIPKWCLFKFIPAKQTIKQGKAPSDTFVMASTVACAAVSGRSRGVVDRARLAAAVLDAIKARMAKLRSNHSNLEFYEQSFESKSGQIQLIFTLPPNSLMQMPFCRSSSCSASGKEESRSTTMNTKVSLEEPFTEFLSRYQSEICSLQPQDRFIHLKESSTSTLNSSQHQLVLVVRTVPVFESSIQPEVHQLFCHYQSSIHGDDNPYLCSEDNKHSDDGNEEEYKHYLRQKRAGFLDVDATYSHFTAAQRSRIKRSYLSFYRFLCETPLWHEALDLSATNEKDNDFILDDGYDRNISLGGTYHQQYRLCTSTDSFDGPLIAVGVVDILPSCLSSVYAFYDPRLSSKLELGKYTALREIEWVRRAKWLKQRNYYLGYYIHSCQKMIYKSEYKPSELLCPVHFKWVDFEVAKSRLEKKSPIRHCCSLFESESTEDSRIQKGVRLECIILDVGESGGPGGINLLNVGMLSREGRKMIDPLIREFVNEVGPDLARKLIVKLS